MSFITHNIQIHVCGAVYNAYKLIDSTWRGSWNGFSVNFPCKQLPVRTILILFTCTGSPVLLFGTPTVLMRRILRPTQDQRWPLFVPSSYQSDCPILSAKSFQEQSLHLKCWTCRLCFQRYIWCRRVNWINKQSWARGGGGEITIPLFARVNEHSKLINQKLMSIQWACTYHWNTFLKAGCPLRLSWVQVQPADRFSFSSPLIIHRSFDPSFD